MSYEDVALREPLITTVMIAFRQNCLPRVRLSFHSSNNGTSISVDRSLWAIVGTDGEVVFAGVFDDVGDDDGLVGNELAILFQLLRVFIYGGFDHSVRFALLQNRFLQLFYGCR